jgi:hypothetical protein
MVFVSDIKALINQQNSTVTTWKIPIPAYVWSGKPQLGRKIAAPLPSLHLNSERRSVWLQASRDQSWYQCA